MDKRGPPRVVYDMDSPTKTSSLRDDVLILSHESSKEPVYESDVHNGVRFTKPQAPSKRDVTILLLANPRSGSQLAGRWVSDYPKETTKLLVTGDKCMTSCRMVVYDVTDKEDKKGYFQELVALSPNGKS